MTLQEFKKSITKDNWFDKYFFYFVSLALLGIGLYFLYEAIFDSQKYSTQRARLLIFSLSVFLCGFGSFALYLVPNRYKVKTFSSNLETNIKKKFILDIMKELGASSIRESSYLTFIFQRRWWTSAYYIYFGIDDDFLFLSVVGSTRGGGFIDFGQTERLRTRLNTIVEEKLKHD